MWLLILIQMSQPNHIMFESLYDSKKACLKRIADFEPIYTFECRYIKKALSK